MFHEAIYELYSDATSITGNDLGDIVVLDANGDEVTIVEVIPKPSEFKDSLLDLYSSEKFSIEWLI